MKTIKGKDIKEIRTIGSMYNNDCICLIDCKDNFYKMKVMEILKIRRSFNTTTFRIVKKIKHSYLEVEK